MKEDNSKRNFNYPAISIEKIVANPDEYIVPECLEACKSFWDRNIFTASCSNRSEKKDKNGNINKYIMVSHLSSENLEIFNRLVQINPNNYRIVGEISDTIYYAIVISSKDNIQERDMESAKLLALASPFKMQDCLEGFISIEDYYLEKLTDPLCPGNTASISIPDSELIDVVKKNLTSSGKLDLLDLDRRIVYKSRFHKNAHQRYLDYLKKQQLNNEDLQEL